MSTQAAPSSPFVGRISEMQRLHASLEEVIASGEPKFIFVSGDYGIGKTSLVQHFLTNIGDQYPQVAIAQGKCSMETESSGLVPFGQILSGLTKRQLAAKQVAEKLKDERMKDFLMKVAPAWLDIVTAGVASAVFTTAEAGAKLMRPSFTLENTFVQFTNALRELTKDKTSLVFIDDLHWADESSIRLLFHVTNNLTNRALLCIATFRPVEARESGNHSALFRDIYSNMLRLGAREIELEKGIDVREYVRARYSQHRIPEALLSEVQERTGGHPLMVTMLFSWWEEIHLIHKQPTLDGGVMWSIAQEKVPAVSIPPSAGAVLEERLRLLDRQLHEELVRASVQGNDFVAQVIMNILSLDEYQLASDLELLEESYRLISEQGTQKLGSTVLDLFSFTHAYYREHIYSRLNMGQRRVLHRQVGMSLEVLYQGNATVSGQLARHFKEAGEQHKAVKYSLEAIQYEQSRFAWLEGEQWCRFGISITKWSSR